MPRLRILADENIPLLEAFADFGEVRAVAGRQITSSMARRADVLLLRSVTRVDAALLQDSPVNFVGTATSGTDHVDEAFLKSRDIAFVSAAGANAGAVRDYVFSAMAWLAVLQEADWRHWRIGIAGAGRIGGELARCLKKLGMHYCIYDPLLGADSEHADALVSFDEILQQDLISLHTPLTTTGPYPTFHMFDKKTLAALRPGTMLINAARGEVLDNRALDRRLREHEDLYCVLDTWEQEPQVNLSLLSRVSLATPHIAGYSEDGKLQGTAMLYEALARHLGKPASFDFSSLLKPVQLSPKLPLRADGAAVVNAALLQAYPIDADHRKMLALLDATDPAAMFDRLRKSYPVRTEFRRTVLENLQAGTADWQTLLQLGFRAG